MASRHADRSRGYRDDRRDRRDDYSRRRDDRYDGDRDRDRERDRYYDDRRDRNRDTYRRRSRSPRRRSRERYSAADKYRDERSRYERERELSARDRPRSRNEDRPRHRSRSRDVRSRDGDRDRDVDRARDSYPDHRRSSLASSDRSSRRDDRDGRLGRNDESRRKQDKPQSKETEKETKLERLEKWKKLHAAKKEKQQVDSPAGDESPALTAPGTPAASATPATEVISQEPAKTKTLSLGTAEKAKQKQKPTIKLDESAKAKPLQGKAAGTQVAATDAERSSAPSVKPSSNIRLKAKTDEDEKAGKRALLDDGDSTKKRKLQALPIFIPSEDHSPVAEDDTIGDMASEDEENSADIQARLEKRRADIASADANDNKMDVDEPSAAEKMDVDESANVEAEEYDPLEAFMAGLTEEKVTSSAPSGQALFGDDHEPLETAVEGEDLIAMATAAAAKRKKKEIPVVDHGKVEYPPFRKNFYTEPREVSEMSPEEVADLRLELDGIKVKPENVPRPVTKWAQMGLLQQTMDVFQQVGYAKPTSIQSQAIPIAESGHDLIGVAKTGSGKTLAFGIPVIRHILDQPPLKSTDGPIVLILAPTRELSLQIVNELRPFLKASNLKIECAYGGASIAGQIAALKRGGIHVLCATPGRLIDLLQSNSGRVLSFKRITYCVLDEADRMFDMGFEPQVMKILASVRPDRQTILFSATFPKSMAALARKALRNPVEVIIGGRSVVAPEITQIVKIVPPEKSKKLNMTLLHLGQLTEDEDARALIFVERHETAEDLLSKIMKNGYPCNAIHGGKDQHDRTDAINDFKQGAIPVLIATSVAARGLDVPQLRLVINYDCPTHLEDYVHRCGRTGRAGKTGTAVTLLEKPGQERFAMHISKALKQSGQEIPPGLKEMTDIFEDKVKEGTEKWYDGGFGGKGLDKLDVARAREKKLQKRATRKDFDDGGSSDSEPETKPVIVKNANEPVAAEAEEPAYLKLLTSKIVITKTERPAPGEVNDKLTPRERAQLAAKNLSDRLSKKGTVHAGQPIDNKGPDAGAYHTTLEINDFPQKARWAVTNRTNVAKILDQTGTSITTKGNFYDRAKGAAPQEGDAPPLYILVEGDTEAIVHAAMVELTRLAREATLAADESSSRAPGRYNVL